MISQNLGWALIHSLWQGLAIYVALRVAVRLVRNSDVRYAIGVGAMALLVICPALTFFVLNNNSATGGFEIVLSASQTSNTESWSVSNFINSNIIWFIRFWALGFAVGLIRIAAGLWYIGRLRHNSHPVQGEWLDMMKRLSESLNINRMVAIAEASISSPMVVGFMKPVILFPVGLLSGLSTEQVETILVHELAHIRRQDYVINLVQSVIETIFFFNPFALLISSMIREERENCCDDMVIAKGISPISYVRTLAQLEASRSATSLALGFAGNKNQLLNRIKRIMENSAKNDWGKGRLLPVALLFLGLVCASWLSISSEKEIQATPVHKAIVSDTSKEDGLVVIKRGRHHNSRVVEEPAEIIPPIDDIPAIDEIPIPGIPEFPGIPEMDFPFDMTWTDSIPGMHFKMHDAEEWESFEREFTEKFKAQFKDFYEKNQSEFRKMMDDMKRDEAIRRRDAAEVVDLAEMQRGFAEIKDFAELHALEQSHDMLTLQKMQLDIMNDQLRRQNFVLEDMNRKTVDYNSALVELLVEDGYLQKGEENVIISDNNGEMIVNGKKVSEKDALKYRALHDTYFGQKRNQRDTYRRSE